MPTQEDIDDLLQRVAIAALAYYPEVHTDEPKYQLDDDTRWCLGPLAGLDSEPLARLHTLIGLTITDPTQHRQDLFGAVLELLGD